MVHLRLLVPAPLAGRVYDHLVGAPGVAHVVDLGEVRATPPGHLVLCDVVREAVNDVIEWLQDQGVHHEGAISAMPLETVVSDAAEKAEAAAPGHGGDALIWEELESRARDNAELTGTYLVLNAIAAVIAGVGILLDSPILIVGAMVIGPEYGPLSALCTHLVRARGRPAGDAAFTLGAGLAAATLAALVATVLFRVTGLGPDELTLGDRELTSFISHPDGMAAVVAVLAGVVGMLTLAQARSSALIGVLVSVTTIPAAANIGVAASYGAWSEMGGAALQLGINLVGLVVAGVVTLAAHARLTRART